MKNLIEIDDKYYQNAKVIILPTNRKATLKGNELWININGELKLSKPNSICPGPQVFHSLYITSDEEIKEGDWVIYVKSVFKVLKINKNNRPVVKMSDGEFELSCCEKIIATTDTSLRCTTMEIFGALPQPSQQFIQYYINEYNKGNVITDILVECNKTLVNAMEPLYTMVIEDKDVYQIYCRYRLNIKVNSDNTINIKPIKNSWSREQVVDIIKVFCNDYDILTSVDQWCEENLI